MSQVWKRERKRWDAALDRQPVERDYFLAIFKQRQKTIGADMNGDRLHFPDLSDSFRRSDARNRENMLQARLGIRTSADIYQAFQSDLGRATAEGSSTSGGASGGIRPGGLSNRTAVDVAETSRTAPPKGPKGFPSLKTVGRYWGEEKVQHYRWADRGEGYCNKLCSAAREVWDWEEAVVKLNRLIHRRAQQLRRRDVKKGVNPIEPDDLINLRAWSHQDPYVKKGDDEGIALPFRKPATADLPAGFGFDKFGLVVRNERPQPESVIEGAVRVQEQQQSGSTPMGEFTARNVQQQPGSLESGTRGPRRQHQETRKRCNSIENGERGSKRAKTAVRRERSEEELMEDLSSILNHLDEEFAAKERLSQEQTWCTPIPLERKVSTVRKFYKAFHNANTLPIHTYMVYYSKYAKAELEDINWVQRVANSIGISPFRYSRYCPTGENIPMCREYLRYLGKGVLSPAAHLHTRLGCEHTFPDAPKGLTVVEEKLIALNSYYSLITKYSAPDGRKQSVRYPKHVKGHITVFPNNVQELVTNVLPHPLLKMIEEIHISWQGPEKPAPNDLSALLSVRRRVIEKALVWLKRNNPLYTKIDIDTAEMDSWEAPSHGVPPQIYTRLERNEPSVWEKTRTAQLVPPTERGLEEGEPTDIREPLASLERGDSVTASRTGLVDLADLDCEDGHGEAVLGDPAATVHKISSSGMFALDVGPDIADAEKLRYVCDALDPHNVWNGKTGSAWMGSGNGGAGNSEPYIVVSHGDDFADSFDARFFAKTFPTLFPLGSGGPRQAEESIEDGAGGGVSSAEAETAARSLVASRNISLET